MQQVSFIQYLPVDSQPGKRESDGAYNCAVFKEAADNLNNHAAHEVQEDTIEPALVREELRRIVSSRHFQTSRRGKEFLEYVVNQKISGHGDLLKERLIGVQ